MYSVLIVDDEPRVLQGLRRMLRGKRKSWHMEFAEGGIEALKLICQTPYDVVISDMRMPNINGSELLAETRNVRPETARIILSGQCDEHTVVQCVGPAHQFLTKPCDAVAITNAIESVCARRDVLSDPLLQRETSRLTAIPSSPSSYARLLELLAEESPSMQAIEETVSSDVGLTARVMQLVSSSFFGRPQECVGIAQAVRMLGVKTLMVLASESEAFRPLTSENLTLQQLEALQVHARKTAERARNIAKAAGAPNTVQEHAFVAGMLHCLSMFVAESIFASGPSRDSTTSLPCRPNHCCIHSQLGVGTECSQISACLLALWGLPPTIVEAVGGFLAPGETDTQGFTPLTALHVAHAASRGLDLRESLLDMNYLDRTGCADQVGHWLEICGDEATSVCPTECPVSADSCESLA